jgi:hypothetical protein
VTVRQKGNQQTFDEFFLAENLGCKKVSQRE